MLTIYFGEFTTGRLNRLQYLGYYVLLTVVLLALGILLAAVLGVSAPLPTEEAAGDPARVRQELAASLSPLALLVFATIGLAGMIAGLNLAAKRFRDMGLPGGWSALGVIVLSLLATALFGEYAANLVALLVLLVLLLVPSGALGARA